jgi:hypothetical protein
MSPKTLAICVVCGEPANHTQRLVASSDRVLVGATGLYEARSSSLPTLTLRLGTGGTMTITWSDAANQFDLEETDQLSTPIGWKTVANKSQQGDQWTVTWQPSDASQTHFFRLKSR